MEKRRVYQVAKEQKLSSDALISMLKEMDFEVKSHMSVVSEDMLNAITRKIQEEKQSSIAEVKRQKAKEDSRKQSDSPGQEAPQNTGKSPGPSVHPVTQLSLGHLVILSV